MGIVFNRTTLFLYEGGINYVRKTGFETISIEELEEILRQNQEKSEEE